ncbi:hypothetical protein [uncultured Endozoicomonas sp.]|uniref:hypothetical protein n=1 Tax=uncultured Endozoicomonas sp. TaxID=432652 RepID=UPI00261B9659|nr:hypothetical protein [uncultured Endozoicomonas sp.]
MAINSNDVKLFESQRLTDEEDGGGRVTGNEVIDGNVNNLFRDISRIDRTIGDVALRKAFVGISTDNNDPYLGSHLILTEPPKDKNVSVLLFDTDSQTDERGNARDRIESYVVPGIQADWHLIGNQLEGQRSVVGYQRESSPIPEIGEVYRLTNPDSFGQASQFIRITSVSHELVTFSYNTGSSFIDFERRKIELEISAPLIATFIGSQPVPGAPEEATSLIQGTQIADTSRYYGIQSLSADVNAGDLNIKAESVYAPLVPSAKVETPLLDQYGGYTGKTMVATAESNRSVSCRFVHISGNQSRTYLQRGVLPGTLTLSFDGGTFQDDGAGNLIPASGSNNYSRMTVDYELGEVNVWRTSNFTVGNGTAIYQPAVGIKGAAVSGAIEVTNQNRGFNYTLNMAEAKPRPGTLVVSYIALGKWQDIRDTGNGQMTGSGTGTIIFSTGSAAITLDALPDPDSALVFSYIAQNDDEVTIRTGNVPVDNMVFRHTVEKPGIKPGSLTVTYVSSGDTKILTDQSNGLLTGDGNGVIHYAPGELSFTLDFLPDSDTEIQLTYEEGTSAGGEVIVSVDGQGVMSGTIPDAPLLPGSIQLQFLVTQKTNVPSHSDKLKNWTTYSSTKNVAKTISDDTAGGWRGVTGVIDYQTGAFTVLAVNDYNYPEYTYEWASPTRVYKIRATNKTLTQVFNGGSITAIAQASNLAHAPHTESISSPELTIDLLPLMENAVLLPGSVVFEWNNEMYFDRDGVLYRDISTETNAGIQVGQIDYSGGNATLAVYPSGTVNTATLHAGATIGSGFQIDNISFRTPGSPLRQGSLQLTAVRVDNADIITATADFNGVIDTAEVQGKIDVTTGWCELSFTDGTDPIYVIPQSIRYNCIVETSLPLDAELIGLDPVRLPADGRVPIFRAGDIVVISHTASTDAGTPTAGQQIILSRDHQAEITVEDSSGVLLAADQYTVDREAGTLDFASPLSLVDSEGAALSAPFAIKDRVEHMSVLSDVQINGDLSIIAPVPWNLPAAETTVSSAVVYGDMQARVKNFFSQKVWTSGDPNWTDYSIGDQTTAQYNTINYPVETTNKGAIYGKWAIIFTSSTAFQVVEEKLGIIGTGSTATDTIPVNPLAGVPYFTIKADGWGSGWATGNAVRFNTDGCLASVWVCRTVLSGQGTETSDDFTLQIRGDAD